MVPKCGLALKGTGRFARLPVPRAANESTSEHGSINSPPVESCLASSFSLIKNHSCFSNSREEACSSTKDFCSQLFQRSLQSSQVEHFKVSANNICTSPDSNNVVKIFKSQKKFKTEPLQLSHGSQLKYVGYVGLSTPPHPLL